MAWARVCGWMRPDMHRAQVGESLQARALSADLTPPPGVGKLGLCLEIPRIPLRARFFPHGKF